MVVRYGGVFFYIWPQGGTMNTVWQVLRYCARMFLKTPGYALTSALTIALGIGANTAIFSPGDGQTEGAHDEDWPEFRGPTGQGHSDERGLPLTWSETKNVLWKVAIPGKGWSSPAILGDRIWLTTATEEGKSLRAISLDRKTGAIL